MRAKQLFKSLRGRWWKTHGLQHRKTKTQTQQPSSSSGICSVCMNGTKINIETLDILSILSKYNTQPYLMKQPHTIQKVILVKVSVSGKKRKCKWLQMRSICCQSTGEFEYLSSRAAEENQHNMKRKCDFTILEPTLRNTGLFFFFFFLSSYIAATKISASIQLHVKQLALSKGPNNNWVLQIKNQNIPFI